MTKFIGSRIAPSLRAATALWCGLFPAIVLASTAKADEITVNITRLKALDKIDQLSAADFLARVTISGEVFETKVVRNKDVIRPDWIVRKRVAAGSHDIKIEIVDKDVTKSELIDVNRIDNKRDLDFKVDTRSCLIGGFSETIRCGTLIRREGQEVKKAEIVFSVAVSRN
jgi:hypothetical protein